MKLLCLLPEYVTNAGGGIITFYRHFLPLLAAQGHQVRVIVGSGVVAERSPTPVVIDGVTEGLSTGVATGPTGLMTGPVTGVAANPRYLDVWVPAGRRKTLRVETSQHAFSYVFEGAATFRDASAPMGVRTEQVAPPDATKPSPFGETGNRSLVLFDRGDEVTVQAGEAGVRFLLISGTPIEEPVAWYGPIVMNTEAELQQAYTELREGTFIRTARPAP